MWEEYPIARKSVKVPAEALEWSLASEEVVNPVCPMMNIQLDRRSQELVDLSTMSHGSTVESAINARGLLASGLKQAIDGTDGYGFALTSVDPLSRPARQALSKTPCA
jgi:hypothetical protein